MMDYVINHNNYLLFHTHHVALNLRFNRADIEKTLKRLTDNILPDFAE
jgi:hypothetical protein